jgi:hypothetical protein
VASKRKEGKKNWKRKEDNNKLLSLLNTLNRYYVGKEDGNSSLEKRSKNM